MPSAPQRLVWLVALGFLATGCAAVALDEPAARPQVTGHAPDWLSRASWFASSALRARPDTTPAAGIRLAETDGAPLTDVPPPPNAQFLAGGRLTTAATWVIESRKFQTDDSPASLAAHYRERLLGQTWSEVSSSVVDAEATLVFSRSTPPASLTVTATRQNGHTEVALIRVGPGGE